MSVSYEVAEAIRGGKARYCRYLDTKQWEKLADIAMPDADLTFLDEDGEVLKVGGVRFVFASPAAFAKTMAVIFRNARTSHQVTNSELTHVSDTQVSAVWAMSDYLVLRPLAGIVPVVVFGHGRYHEIWEEHAGDWRLRQLTLRRTSTTVLGLAGWLDRMRRPKRGDAAHARST